MTAGIANLFDTIFGWKIDPLQALMLETILSLSKMSYFYVNTFVFDLASLPKLTLKQTIAKESHYVFLDCQELFVVGIQNKYLISIKIIVEHSKITLEYSLVIIGSLFWLLAYISMVQATEMSFDTT